MEVRVSSGHLCEAEAPTEAVAENSVPARKVEPSSIEKQQFRDELPAGGDGTPPLHRYG